MHTQECLSGADPLGAHGNTELRDCSGRGVCNYNSGICKCFPGFSGVSCDKLVSYY